MQKLLLLLFSVLGNILSPYFSLSLYPIGLKFDLNNSRVPEWLLLLYKVIQRIVREYRRVKVRKNTIEITLAKRLDLKLQCLEAKKE